MKTTYLLIGILFLTLVACTEEAKENVLEWDFNKDKSYDYTYSQIIDSEAIFSRDSITPTMINSVVNFDLMITTDSTEWANLTMSNASVTMNGQKIDQIIPDVDLQKMDKHGKFKNSNADAIFDILLALPKKDLKVGATDEVALIFPFNTPDSVYQTKGVNRMKFSHIETKDSVECAVLMGEILFDEKLVPQNESASYKFLAKGTSILYFDLENQCVKQAKIDVNLDALWDSGVITDTTQVSTYSKIKMHSVYEIIAK